MGSMRPVTNYWQLSREKPRLLRLLNFMPMAQRKVSTSGESVRYKQMERKFRWRATPWETGS